NLVYAGSSEGLILCSSDAGLTWNNFSSLEYHIWNILVYDDNIFAATMGAGVMKSNDNGTTWEPVNEGFPDMMDIHKLFLYNDSLYAGVSAFGVYKTSPDDINWMELSTGLGSRVIYDFDITTEGIITSTNKGVYQLTDGSEIWESMNGDITADAQVYSVLYTQLDYIFAGDNKGNIYRTSEQLIKEKNKLYISITPETTQLVDWSENVEFQILATDSEDNPVENATISVEDNLNNTTDELTTDQNGNVSYSFVVEGGFENGLYEITFQASKDGYETSDIITRYVEIEHKIPGNGWQEITTNLPTKESQP
ncbi:hypothetical protein ACFLSQ_10490, partial [Bacteroidota bacterium]